LVKRVLAMVAFGHTAVEGTLVQAAMPVHGLRKRKSSSLPHKGDARAEF